MATQLRFLGSGDSQGVPRLWCECKVCTEARTTGQNARTRPSALLETPTQTILLDASPDLRSQLIRESVKTIDAVLITHAHNDHILGLGDVGDLARWTGKTIPIYAPAEVLPVLKERFAYMTRGSYTCLTPFHALESTDRTFGNYRVSAHKVPHGHNGYAYGFRFTNKLRNWAYVPDSIGINDLKPWQNLDLLVLGTSFYQEHAPYEKRSVYDVVEALELLQTLKPKRTVFTHLGHGVDCRKPAPEGTQYASDGLSLPVSEKSRGTT